MKKQQECSPASPRSKTTKELMVSLCTRKGSLWSNASVMLQNTRSVGHWFSGSGAQLKKTRLSEGIL